MDYDALMDWAKEGKEGQTDSVVDSVVATDEVATSRLLIFLDRLSLGMELLNVDPGGLCFVAMRLGMAIETNGSEELKHIVRDINDEYRPPDSLERLLDLCEEAIRD